MEKIAIRLKEKNGIARIKEPASLGIPLPKGAVNTVHQLALMDGQKAVSVQFVPLGRWPDGSIQWVHASFLATLDPSREKELTLVKPQPALPPDPLPTLVHTISGTEIPTLTGSVTLYANCLAWQANNGSDTGIPSTITLRDNTNYSCTAEAQANWEIVHRGSVFVAATLSGHWVGENNELLARFHCELRIFLEVGLVQVTLTTHNPKRARHSGGLWDLGDPGSLYFRALAIETRLPGESMAQVTPQAIHTELETFSLSNFNLYQDSSGGENWQSPNHIDSNGDVSTQFCGYRLANMRALLHEGKRANPLISINHDCGQLSVAVPGFWQNFPTSLRKDTKQLTIGLFPEDAKNAYELQGGEQKTLCCFMAYDSCVSASAIAYTPLVPILSPKCYQQAEVFPWFWATNQPDALGDLIIEGLNGSSNFFAKRELIDEFGWRNFGDIFADHETLYQAEGESPFISHYNNQYDPIYGFARQFALTGDTRWFELMDDLARHVTDIDIYHTEQDRAEYNNGLFWHTDHYLDAHTATHRTFSQHNESSSTPGQTGGGPAEEHCYSTGLLYHYYLTGNENSRQAVLKLAGWITALHEGSGGFFEQLLALKKREIPPLKKMIRGEKVSTHRYPFNRGTGNYLNTLIDAWLLDPHGGWLKQTEIVIRKTIHPADNIEVRNLLDVENRWSYLILLTSMFRYLYLKQQIDGEDEQYEYAKASVMRYTEWMLNNERPFMASKIQLEYPNDTWVAQDARKAMLMFQASELDRKNSERYRSQGQQWLEEVTTALQASQENHLSRILIILMQNHGPHQLLASSSLLTKDSTTSMSQPWPPPVLTWRLLMSRIGRRALRALLTFRPSRERLWLTTRLDRS